MFGSWAKVLEQLHRWLGYLRRELEAPDFWAMVSGGQLLGTSAQAEQENAFDPEEVAQIEQQLAALNEHIQQVHELTKAQAELITDQLGQLVELARTEPRSRWRAMFIGYFVSYLIEALLPPEVVRDLVLGGLRGLANLFGGDVPELPRGGGGPFEPA